VFDRAVAYPALPISIMIHSPLNVVMSPALHILNIFMKQEIKTEIKFLRRVAG
jgi:hypothetical protein